MGRGPDREGKGAVLVIERPFFNQLVKQVPDLKPFTTSWEYQRDDDQPHIRVPVRLLSKEALLVLKEIYKDNGGTRKWQWPMRQLDSHLDVLDDPESSVVEKLRALETAVIAYIRKGILNGWVFRRDKAGRVNAWLVYDVNYNPAYKREDRYVPANVTMTLAHWSQGKVRYERIVWHEGEIRGQKVGHILHERGVMHETKDLIADYEASEKRFLKWRAMLGEQFVGNGKDAFTAADRWYEHDSDLHGTRLVVDDRCDEIENHMATMIFRSHDLDEDVDDKGEESMEEADRYTRLPVHPYVWCFNLSSHRGGFVHIDNMEPYKYRPELRHKLVLHPEHEDLIDALTADMDVLLEDIVKGKSGGTTIFCQGKPGVGKTLTAEIYAEVVKRPLYRVHSGQLGTNAEQVEQQLTKALDNAKRWRALLLIDEADVFVCQRGNDLEMNAVVGVFLRLLEYYDGVLFMTTNRLDMVDDAILSRCIAQIRYDVPGVAERAKLWRTLGEVYKMELVQDAKVSMELAKTWGCTGRDIKGLIRLTVKYCRQHKKKPTVADIKRLAIYKGLK